MGLINIMFFITLPFGKPQNYVKLNTVLFIFDTGRSHLHTRCRKHQQILNIYKLATDKTWLVSTLESSTSHSPESEEKEASSSMVRHQLLLLRLCTSPLSWWIYSWGAGWFSVFKLVCIWLPFDLFSCFSALSVWVTRCLTLLSAPPSHTWPEFGLVWFPLYSGTC